MTVQETGSPTQRAIEVGKTLAAVQAPPPCGHFREARQVATLKYLLTGGGMRGWTAQDGTKLLDVIGALRYYQVKAEEVLIRDDPERAGLLERGYKIRRRRYVNMPPFAQASIRRILELLTWHFPSGVELDGMIAAIETRLIEAVVPYFSGKLEKCEQLERWDARSTLRRLRVCIETFRKELRWSAFSDQPTPPPALAQLFERLEQAERRANEWPFGFVGDKYHFRASTEYRTGRHDTARDVTFLEYEASTEEKQCVPANGQRVRAFRLLPACGLLTLTDVHFHLQERVLKRAGFLPRLGVDYVLRAADARDVKVLSNNPAVIERLLVYRAILQKRTDAPYRCVSVRGLDPLDNLGIPRAVLRIDRGPDGPWVHVG